MSIFVCLARAMSKDYDNITDSGNDDDDDDDDDDDNNDGIRGAVPLTMPYF
jgi:hypothetical protein